MMRVSPVGCGGATRTEEGGDYRRADLGAVASVVTAEVANARFGPALEWSVAMADLVAEITGRAVLFGRGVAGRFGTVGWVVTVPDIRYPLHGQAGCDG